MSKLSKISLVIGLCLISLGVILSKFDAELLFNPFYDESKYEKREIIVSNIDEINKIIIDTKDDSIVFEPSKTNELKIIYYDADNDYYIYEENGGKITLKNKTKMQFFNLNINFYTKDEIIIQVPEKLLLNYEIKTTNGKLEIDSVNVNEFSFKTTNGKIEINGLEASNSLSLNTNNGKISLTRVFADEIIGSTTNGKIILEYVKADKIDIKTTNGKINFDKIESENIKLISTNGKINGSINGVHEEYKRYMKTTNGNITIDGTEYSKKIEDTKSKDNFIYLKTTNGTIDVDFIK